jgi:phospholipase C
VYAELVSRLPVPDAQGGTYHVMPAFTTEADVDRYISKRLVAWKASRASPA